MYKTYKLKIIWSENPKINRKIKICGNKSLDDLSDIILKSFKFDHSHLYLFNFSENPYSGELTYEFNDSDVKKSTKVKINDLQLDEENAFWYWYDFGDDWIFIICIESIYDDEKCLKPQIIESFGKLDQYGNKEDFYEDDLYQQQL